MLLNMSSKKTRKSMIYLTNFVLYTYLEVIIMFVDRVWTCVPAHSLIDFKYVSLTTQTYRHLW